MFVEPLVITATTAVPFIVMIAGLLITIFYLLYIYEGGGSEVTDKRESVRRDRLEKGEFECPRCRAHVDASSRVCLDCGAEFEMDRYSCPSCGVEVAHDDGSCPECNEPFVVDGKEFVCPVCKEHVEMHSTRCDACGAGFWSPVKKYTRDLTVEEEKTKKIDPSFIEIIGEDQD